ncbi:unnamed protein product [Candidula unifasciata]|uniref:G-protein coupled receptors family 1 profile domain-containing protein n=1 Tax=Candidula unifasciata TaxID=100452 RepID=A0A8S3Z0N7_9EUPU|nr:unnamed protein product [Candidula unifasciata]
MAQAYVKAIPCLNNTLNLTVYFQHFRCSKLEINLTTCQPIQTPDEIDTIQTLCDAADIIWITGFWFSVVSGIVGNGLAILTIASLHASTATFFVGLLAVSDLIAICIQVLVQYADKYGIYNRASASWELSIMLYDISISYSNWLLVLICLERYLTVRFPLHKRYYFTLTHARISAVVLALLVFGIYNSATWTLGYNDIKMYKIRNLFYAGLPLAFILVIISLISYQLRKIHRDRQTLNGRVHSRMGLSSMDEQQSAGLTTGRSSNNLPLQEIARLENSITVMMLVAAVCFSILTIPNCVLLYTYIDYAISWNTPVLRARWHLFQRTSQVLTYLNLSVNFVLYFLSAKKFRTQLVKVVFSKPWFCRRSQSQIIQPFNNNSKIDSTNVVIDADYLTFHRRSDTSPSHTDNNISSDSAADGIRLSSIADNVALEEHSPIEAASQEIYNSYPALRTELYGSVGSRV